MVCCAPNPAVGSCSGANNTGQQLSYDAEGRLSGWQNAPGGSPNATASFRYDGEGERVAQQTTSSGTTTTTRYLLGGLEELTTVGSTTTLTKYYSVPGVVTAVKVGTTLSYLATDGLGSVSVALSSSGSATGQALYSPYGQGRYASGSLPTARGYTGQYQDATSGLDYYGARYYDPMLGQFTSADSELNGLDPYAYTDGNPCTYDDPSGHCSGKSNLKHKLDTLIFILGLLQGIITGTGSPKGPTQTPIGSAPTAQVTQQPTNGPSTPQLPEDVPAGPGNYGQGQDWDPASRAVNDIENDSDPTPCRPRRWPLRIRLPRLPNPFKRIVRRGYDGRPIVRYTPVSDPIPGTLPSWQPGWQPGVPVPAPGMPAYNPGPTGGLGSTQPNTGPSPGVSTGHPGSYLPGSGQTTVPDGSIPLGAQNWGGWIALGLVVGAAIIWFGWRFIATPRLQPGGGGGFRCSAAFRCD